MDGFLTWLRSEEERLDCYTTPNVFTLYHHMVARASIRDSAFHGVRIKRGSLATSTEKLASMAGLSIKQARNAIDSLIASGDIIKEPHGTFTVYTIVDFDRFCGVPDDYSGRANRGQTEGNTEGKQRANGGQHKNKGNKDNNIKNINTALDAWRDAGFAEKDTLKNKDLCEGLLRLLDDYGEESVLQGIANASASDFLRGQKWFGLWWFVKPDNFQKVLDGKYAKRGGKPEVPAQADKPHEMTWEESEAFRKKVMGD